MFAGLRAPRCFSAPEAVLSEVEQRFDFVQAQTHLLSEFGGGCPPPILNRIPLIQVRGQTHSTDRMLSPIEELRTYRPTRMNRDKEKATKQGEMQWIVSSRSCISSVAARMTGNSPSAPASPTEEVDRWKVCTWSRPQEHSTISRRRRS